MSVRNAFKMKMTLMKFYTMKKIFLKVSKQKKVKLFMEKICT